jgi:hypothetical protein
MSSYPTAYRTKQPTGVIPKAFNKYTEPSQYTRVPYRAPPVPPGYFTRHVPPTPEFGRKQWVDPWHYGKAKPFVRFSVGGYMLGMDIAERLYNCYFWQKPPFSVPPIARGFGWIRRFGDWEYPDYGHDGAAINGANSPYGNFYGGRCLNEGYVTYPLAGQAIVPYFGVYPGYQYEDSGAENIVMDAIISNNWTGMIIAVWEDIAGSQAKAIESQFERVPEAVADGRLKHFGGLALAPDPWYEPGWGEGLENKVWPDNARPQTWEGVTSKPLSLNFPRINSAPDGTPYRTTRSEPRTRLVSRPARLPARALQPAGPTTVFPPSGPPVVITNPPPHLRQPPNEGEHEKKGRMGFTGKGTLMRAINFVTETQDAVDAAFYALPKKVIAQERSLKRSPLYHAQVVLENLSQLDLDKFGANLIVNEAIDRGLGTLGGKVAKYSKPWHDLTGRPVGWSTGPAL